MADAVNHPSFVPHLTLHETETWVLAAVEHVGTLFNDSAGAAHLRVMAQAAGGPELVNDGARTAPSKRLLARWPKYQKTLDGPLAVEKLGLVGLRQQCPHADSWLSHIESFR